jgi:hypothetical protein
MRVSAGTSALLIGLGAVLFASPARADRVDGEWCDATGLRVVIQGDAITTPTGARLSGRNRRHSFDYDAPAGETPAGRVLFQQFNDDLIRSSSDDALEREWRRCKPVS